MSTHREDVADLISAQIQVALKKEYDRGWNDCMEYYWSKREMEENRKDGERVRKGHGAHLERRQLEARRLPAREGGRTVA